MSLRVSENKVVFDPGRFEHSLFTINENDHRTFRL